MILFPAMDLKDGCCVRLRQGDMRKVAVFHEDPAAQARMFVARGFSHLHVVDLDGAVAGKPVNAEAVLSVLSAAPELKMQLGGGIRDMERIAFWMEQGVARVILGTAALENPPLLREACQEFPGRIIIALDERGGRVAVKGWRETRAESAIQVARRFRDMSPQAKGEGKGKKNAGIAAILHTAIEQDGMMTGMNVDASVRLAQETRLPVILSGGFRGAADIDNLLRAVRMREREAQGELGEAGGETGAGGGQNAGGGANRIADFIEGIVAGRGLYENLFDCAEMLTLCRRARESLDASSGAGALGASC